MNRVASRAMISLILVVAMLAGMVFFVAEYVSDSHNWALNPGSPHIAQAPKGYILDRDGAVLLDISGDRSFAADPLVREANLHWVGYRQGNISRTLEQAYREKMMDYDSINGLYTYGGAEGRIHTTLSSDLQKAALQAMGSNKGTVAVYNYKTGELICAVSTPSFDPDNIPDFAADSTGTYEGVYMNRFVQNTYTPGSIFKIVTLAAALETLPDAREMTFYCDGVHEIGKNGKVTCMGVHGEQTLKQAFRNSCNCAFAQLVEKIGKERLQEYVELFGVVDSFGFDGYTCKAGNFDLSQAGEESQAWSGIGQYTDMVNPCAYLRFVGAVAAGGAGYDPYVVSKVTLGKKTTYQVDPKRQPRIMSQETAATIREYMRNNVASNYGDENFHGFTACAKTGTAEVGSTKKPNAMLAGFLLDDDYPYAFVVVVEDAGFGRTVCVPIISAILAELA